MSSLDNLIDEIHEWQRETFPHSSFGGASEHLKRETQELWEHYHNPETQELWEHYHNPALWQTERVEPLGTVQERAEEMADIFFLLVQLAVLEGVDLATAVDAKLTKNRARKWKAPDAMGVVEHEED